MKRLAAVALALAVALSGCGGSDDEGIDFTGEADNGIAEASYGRPYDYGDGLVVTASEPYSYTPVGQYGSGEGTQHPSHARIDITIKNDTGAPFDPGALITSAASGGEESPEVFDDEMGDSPSTTVDDGGSVALSVAYSVADPGEVTLEVSPDTERPPIVFTSK